MIIKFEEDMKLDLNMVMHGYGKNTIRHSSCDQKSNLISLCNTAKTVMTVIKEKSKGAKSQK
jgi:hypothetical protein